MKREKVVFLLLLLASLAWSAYGQGDEASVAISPAVPRPGELVLVSISVPRFAAADLEALEPELEGPLRYIGSFVRPAGGDAAAGGGAEGSIIELRLLALAQGRAEIRRLGYAVLGKPLYLGSYAVEIAPAPGAATLARPGTWLAPGEAYPYAPFTARAVGPGGETLAIATPSVRGALFYPLGALPSSAFLVSISGAEDIRLPALNLVVGGKSIRVEAHTVARRSLPAAVEASRAVGAWNVELRALSHGNEALIGDIVIVEGVARGVGSASLAAAPRVRVLGPDKRSIAVLTTDASLGDFSIEGESFAGERRARVSFQVMEAGRYTIELEPYPWYDNAGGAERSARAKPLFLSVKARVYENWLPSEGQKATLEALIANGSAGAAREQAAGRLARAARSLLEGDALAALHEAKLLERSFWPPADASTLGLMAMDALGLGQEGRVDLLPPPGWFALAALPCAALAVLLFALRKKAPVAARAGTNANHKAIYFALSAILSLVLIVMCVASWAGRSRERALVFVSALRAVPDDGASVPFSVAPGSQAAIVSEGGAWLFIEFSDGRSAWIRDEHIGRY